MKFLPYVFFSFRVKNKDVLSADASFDYNWGLALFEEDIRKLNLEVDENIEYIEPKSYISSVIASSDDYIMRGSLQFMFDYLRTNQYTMNGDIFGKIIVNEITGTKKQSYLEVNIPILSNN